MSAPSKPRPASTHDCPGCRAVQVPRHKLSCRNCWYRLPRELRNRISNAYRRDPDEHLHAVGEAIQWYGDNPPAGRVSP